MDWPKTGGIWKLLKALSWVKISAQSLYGKSPSNPTHYNFLRPGPIYSIQFLIEWLIYCIVLHGLHASHCFSSSWHTSAIEVFGEWDPWTQQRHLLREFARPPLLDSPKLTGILLHFIWHLNQTCIHHLQIINLRLTKSIHTRIFAGPLPWAPPTLLNLFRTYQS